jgi:RNA polymerase sigma-70 factor (ECF subfamily)
MSAKISDLGRRREFDDLVRELRPDLYRYAFWLSRSSQVADDVVQEALLRAWKA